MKSVDRMGSALAGGLFGSFKLPDDLTFVVERGSGPWLQSTQGDTYLDHVLGSGPLVLGHAHPRVVEAIRVQAERGSTFYALNESGALLAERIAELVPCAEAVKLVTSGSEAVFYALRIARAATGRSKIVKFDGGYHGHNDYSLHTLKAADDTQGSNTVPTTAGIPAAVSSTVLVAPFNDFASTEKLLDEHADDIAAIVVEPVQRAIEPRPGFLEGLRSACERIGALLVFDEVVTGFRLGLGGAQEAYGVVPHLCALGKIIGGGLPLAAVAGARDLIELTVPGSQPYAYLSGTLNGNALAAEAGLATIEVLREEDGCARLAEVGRTLSRELTALAAELSIPFQMIGPPSFPQAVFGEEPIFDSSSLQNSNVAAAQAFGLELIRQRVFVHPAQKMYMSVVHGPNELERFLDAARAALSTLSASGIAETR